MTPGTQLNITLNGSATGLCDDAEIAEQNTITVIDCPPSQGCECPGTSLPAIVGNQYFSQTYLANMVNPFGQLFLAEQCVPINGTLHIDMDVAISLGDIIMYPGAEIIVETDAWFSLNVIDIYGCDQLWKSITVKDGAEFTINGEGLTSIQDALYGGSSSGRQQIAITSMQL